MSMKAFGSSAVLGASACLIALASTHLGGADHPNHNVVTIQSSTNEGSGAALGQAMMADMSAPTAGEASGGIAGAGASGIAMAGAYAGVITGGANPSAPAVARSSVSIAPAVKSKTAFQLIERLDEPLPMATNEVVTRFARDLSAAIASPVFIDQPALAELGINPDGVLIRVDSSDVSTTRSVLRQALHPHGLRAVVEEDGLLITIDWAEQIRRGRATDRWLDVPPDDADTYDALPQMRVSVNVIEAPLEDVVRDLSAQIDFPILLDRRGLEEIGITEDLPITLRLNDISLGSALNLMLHENDLTYAFRDEALVITTIDAADSRLRNRAYFVEDIVGLSESADFSQLMQLIQTTVFPDTWEALGGPSTMFPMANLGTNRRSALIVSTSDTTHHDLEMFLAGLRGLSPLHSSDKKVERPAKTPPKSASATPRTKPRSSKSRNDDPFSGQDPFGAGESRGSKSTNPFGKPTNSKPSDDPFGFVEPGPPSADNPFGINGKDNPFG